MSDDVRFWRHELVSIFNTYILPGFNQEKEKCERCDGIGFINIDYKSWLTTEKTVCPDCSGYGFIVKR